MDADEETKKFKLIAGLGAAFVVSMVVSCQELKYTMWGKAAEAKVLKMEEVVVRVGRRGREEPRMRIHFTYDDAGATVKMIDSYPIHLDYSNAQATGKLPIQYLSGDKYSARMAGTGKVIGVVAFFVFLGLFVLTLIKYSRDAKRPI